jgi:hypothetical protein
MGEAQSEEVEDKKILWKGARGWEKGGYWRRAQSILLDFRARAGLLRIYLFLLD